MRFLIDFEWPMMVRWIARCIVALACLVGVWAWVVILTERVTGRHIYVRIYDRWCAAESAEDPQTPRNSLILKEKRTADSRNSSAEHVRCVETGTGSTQP